MIAEPLPPATVGTMNGAVTLQGVPDDFIEGAIVQAFRDPGSAPIAQATTDSRGRFRLKLGPGTYLVRVNKKGFRESELTVTNTGAGTPALSVVLYLGI